MKHGRTVAVTGATGFIGQAVVARALSTGWRVRALVLESDERALPSSDMLETVPWSLAQARNDRALQGADAVVHLAAFVPPDHLDPAHAEQCLQDNVLGTLDLLRALEGDAAAHLVYVSGNCYRPRQGLARETDALLLPTHSPFYLLSKLAGEQLVDGYQRMGRLSASALRVGVVYGPGMPAHGALPIFARRLGARQPIQIHDGDRYRADMVYVDDVAGAALAAAENKPQGVLNIGSGAGTCSLHTVARTMAEILGVSCDLIEVLPGSGDTSPTGFTGMDIARAREVIGYAPRSLREGLDLYLKAQ